MAGRTSPRMQAPGCPYRRCRRWRPHLRSGFEACEEVVQCFGGDVVGIGVFALVAFGESLEQFGGVGGEVDQDRLTVDLAEVILPGFAGPRPPRPTRNGPPSGLLSLARTCFVGLCVPNARRSSMPPADAFLAADVCAFAALGGQHFGVAGVGVAPEQVAAQFAGLEPALPVCRGTTWPLALQKLALGRARPNPQSKWSCSAQCFKFRLERIPESTNPRASACDGLVPHPAPVRNWGSAPDPYALRACPQSPPDFVRGTPRRA